jgi:tape measure domain-containing protein
MAGDILTKFKASASVDGTEQLDKLVKKFEQLADSSAATNKILSKLTDISLTSSDVLERIAKSVSGLDSNFKSLNSTIASQTDRLLKQLTESAKASADSIKKAAQESKESFSGIAIGADGSSAAIIGLKGVFGDLFAKAAALKFVGAEFININRNILETQAQVDKLNNILLVKNDGQVDLVKKDLAQLEQLSERLGLRFTETATAYSKIAVAAKGSALEGKGAREVFEAVSASMAKVGVSGDGANRVFLALQQIISKGTVQTEELKGQLGEQIPGAMNIAARAVGVTTAEFAKMLEQGQVISSEFLPKFAQEMLKTFQISSTESVDTATAALNRFDNSIERVQKTLADKLSPAARDVFSGLSSALDYLNIQLKTTEFTLKGTLDLFTRVLSSIPSIPTPFGKIQVGGELIASTKAGRDKQLAELNKALTDEQDRAKDGGLYNSATTSRNIEEIKSLIAEIKKIDAGLDSDGLDETLTTLIAQGRQQSENFKNLQEGYKAQGNAIKGINKDYEIQIKLAKDARAAGIINDAQLTKRLAEIKQKYGEKDNSSGAVEASKRAYDGLIDRIKQVTLAEEQRAAGGDKLNAYQKLALELQVKLESEKSKLLKTDREAIGIQQIIIGFLGDEIAEKEKLAKIDEFFTKLATEKTEAAIKTIDAIEKENEALRVKILNVGADNEETAANLNLKDEARIQALEMAEALYGEADAWDSVRIAQQRELDALKDRVRLRSELGAKRDAKELADGQQKLLDQVTKELSRGITDSIFRGFEGGKKFIQSFKDAIKNAFKSLIIKFAVQPVLGSVIGGVATSLGFTGLAQAAQKELGSFGGVGSIGGSAAGGGASGGSGFGLSEAGGLKSIYDAFAGGVQGLANGATQAAFNLSNFAGASVETSAAIGNFAGAATTAASAIGVAYAGYSLGRGISGGYSLNGGTGNSTVNIGAVVGGFLGAAGGPLGIAIGSAIGSVLGGAVNKLFGSKRVLGASGIQGTFTDDGFSGQTFQDVQIKRKFRSDKSFTNFGSVDGNLLDFLADSVDSLATSAKSAGLVLGTDISGALDRFTLSGRFSVSTQEQLKATLDSVANAIIKQSIPALEQFKQEGENLIQTAARISTAVAKANTASALLGRSAQFGINNAQAALGLQETLGDSLNGLQGALSAFIPQSVLASRQIEDFRETIRALGLDTKITTQISREQFAALLQQVDLNSAAGQRELATLIELAPAVDAIIKQRESEQIALLKTRSVLDGLIASVSGTTNAFANADAAINATKAALFSTTDVQARLDLEATLAQQITDRYALEMQLLDALQEGVQGVFASLGEVRGGVADARASIIGTPLQMNAAQIRSQISANAIASQLPTTAGIEAALKKTSTAQSNLDSILGKQSLLDAAKVTFNAVVAKTVSDVNAFNANTRFGEAYATSSSANGALSGRDRDRASATFNAVANTATTDYAYVSFYGSAAEGQKLADTLRPIVEAIKADNAALQSSKATVDNLAAIVATAPAAQSALTAAQSALTAEKKKFSDAIQAFVIDAGKAVGKLSKLREETVKYFEAQSALAGLMGSSAAGIRSTVESIRFSKLGETDQLAELQAKFATTFASAQSATGENLASLGDKLNTQLDPLLSLAQSIFGTGTDYQRLEGVLLGQAESVATRLEDFAPKDFQAESLGLLDSIDTQISLIEAATKSAETLIVDAINLSRDKTLEGLRGIVAAVQGGPVTAFATGGAFANGVVSRPTAFNPGLMGEAGPEAIMPLTNIGGRLGVRAVGSGNAEMAAEIRALRQEVVQLRRENMAGQAAIASGTNRTAKVLERADNGDSLNIMVVTE